MSMMNFMMSGMMCSMNSKERQNTMLKMMPEMIKSINPNDIKSFMGNRCIDMMFVVNKSRYGFEETIKKVKQKGENFGWYRPVVNNHFEIEKDFEIDNPNKVASVSMCIPRMANQILKINKKMGAIMPSQINIYEENGEIFICWMNLKMMGQFFGEQISNIVNKAQEDLEKLLEEIICEKGEEK